MTSSRNLTTPLFITTRQIGSFLEELGTPSHGAPEPATAHPVERLTAVAARYGYWLGSPRENAAVGIELPAAA